MTDPNSQSNLDEVISRHLSFHWTVHFDKSTLEGYVDVTVEALQNGVKSVVLDSKELVIKRTLLPSGTDLQHKIKSEHAVFGKALEVILPNELNKGDKITIRIEYSTTPESSAIQWLQPSQTADKVHPYLFTQCQAIHARTMVPCQDAPAVKVTYDATVTVPSPLTALMSAIRGGKQVNNSDNTITYTFKQDVPMSSYLIALAVGDVESRDIGPRTKLWSEKSMVDQGAYEFAETETFLKTAEDLMGPYVWGQYDLLLLPPSFPYGGMENPCLTFITPTLLAGDRSNADVVAHEISHSWMGNLVTNKTWEHFWLNEGMTVYAERKIYGRLHGEQGRHFHAVIGYKSLRDSIDNFGEDNPLTALMPNLNGIDPDDAFSSVPYEKGFVFLFYLENVVGGRDIFEEFIKAYVEKFKFSTVSSQEFKDFFLSYFSSKVDKSVLDQIDWNTWFNKPGMPDYIPKFDMTLSEASYNLAQKWITEGGKGTSSSDIENWSAGQIVVFLDKLVAGDPLPHDVLAKVDELYKLSASKNSEIRFRWYQIGIKAEYTPVFDHALEFVKQQGRMKFVRPLYRSLYRSKHGKDAAVKTFLSHHKMYHGIAQKMVAKDLELKDF